MVFLGWCSGLLVIVLCYLGLIDVIMSLFMICCGDSLIDFYFVFVCGIDKF